MPHDNRGLKLEGGDYVIAKAWHRAERNDVMKVIGVNEGSETCNVTAVAMGIPATITLNAKDCEIILKGDGSKPLLPGTTPA